MSVVYKKALSKSSTAIEALGGTQQSDKVAIVTGGNSGIGLETVRALAYAGAKVYLTTRSTKSGENAMKQIRADTLQGQTVVSQMDLQDFKSIDNFTQSFLSQEQRLDYLILNAGVMMPKLMRDQWGYETNFATNHFGHFYLTQKLLPLMLKQQIQSRILVVSSGLHRTAPVVFDDIHFENRKFEKGYGQSKTANVLFAKELADRYKDSNIKAYSLSPGFVGTNLGRNVKITGIKFIDNFLMIAMFKILSFTTPMKTTAQGASTTIYGCVAKELEDKNGAYLKDCAVDPPADFATNPEDAKKLWEISEEAVKKITS